MNYFLSPRIHCDMVSHLYSRVSNKNKRKEIIFISIEHAFEIDAVCPAAGILGKVLPAKSRSLSCRPTHCTVDPVAYFGFWSKPERQRMLAILFEAEIILAAN